MNAVDIVNAADLSFEDFCRQYMDCRRPVLIKGAVANSASKLSPMALKQRFGSKQFKLQGQPESLASIVDRVTADGSSESASKPYLTNVNVSDDFPELVEQLAELPSYAAYNWRNSNLINKLMGYGSNTTQFFMGGEGSGFPFLHVDYPPMHTMSALFHGRKDWILFAPDQTDKLYPTEREGGWPLTSAVDDPYNPDLNKYPLMADVEDFRITQEAGDFIFVPSGWWHTAKNMDSTVTVAWDHLSGSSWRASTKWRLASMKQRSAAFKLLLKPAFFLLGRYYRVMELLRRRSAPERVPFTP